MMIKRRAKRIGDERGAATIEMAISMIVFVPIFLYATLASDLLRFRLEQQEGIASAVWDFTSRDFSQAAPSDDSDDRAGIRDGFVGHVQHYNRLIWCNHTSAHDTFNRDDDCKHETRQTLAADSCWWHGDENGQIMCQQDTASGRVMDAVGPGGGFHDEFTYGGLFHCDGEVSIRNLMLPESFLPQFTNAENGSLAKERQVDGVNAWGDGSNTGSHGTDSFKEGGDFYKMQPFEFGVLTDTWAMYDRGDEEEYEPGDKSGDFYDRVSYIYTENYAYYMVIIQYIQFIADAFQAGFIYPWDNVLTPNISKLHGDGEDSPPPAEIRQESGTGKYHVTPWLDWGDNAYEATWNARDDTYLGGEDY